MPNGNKLRKLMEDKNITQKELQNRTGIDQGRISAIINNEDDIRESTLKRICEALECEAEDIW